MINPQELKFESIQISLASPEKMKSKNLKRSTIAH